MDMSRIGDKDLAMVLRRGADEIESQSRELEVLRAKVDVIEVFKLALTGQRPASQGYGEDQAWKMRKAAEAVDNRTKEDKNEN